MSLENTTFKTDAEYLNFNEQDYHISKCETKTDPEIQVMYSELLSQINYHICKVKALDTIRMRILEKYIDMLQSSLQTSSPPISVKHEIILDSEPAVVSEPSTKSKKSKLTIDSTVSPVDNATVPAPKPKPKAKRSKQDTAEITPVEIPVSNIQPVPIEIHPDIPTTTVKKPIKKKQPIVSTDTPLDTTIALTSDTIQETKPRGKLSKKTVASVPVSVIGTEAN